jgi:hypothetical protein
MEAIDEAISAHRRMLRARAQRDAALRQAMQSGITAYALAQRFRSALGEDNALTSEGIRRIGQREPEAVP